MLNLYDSLTRKTKPFPPEHQGPVTIYACGPTVYHFASIGNLRTFLTVDLLRRHLEYRGKEVRLVMNITDVGHMLNDADVGEDKLEAAAAKEGKTPDEIARFYEAAFFRDMEALDVKPAFRNPRATEHIPEMVMLVEKLLDEGHAYVTEKSDVYFDVASFKDYGKLSGNSVDELVAGARVEVKEDKRHPADFALWINNPDHVMQWKGPRGIQGYPGWHLECSAMAKAYLGETIDLHVGGEDLKFPHHECEIAQSESVSGAPFARHWMHVSFLLVEGEKMSKSKGNIYTLQDLIEKGFSPAAARFLLLSSHYRTQLNFTLDGLKAAENFIRYARETGLSLAVLADSGTPEPTDPEILKYADPGIEVKAEAAFAAAMDDDLNVAVAVAHLHALLRYANGAMQNKAIGSDAAKRLRATLEDLTGVFGLKIFDVAEAGPPADVKALAVERETARAEKRWKDSDRLRDAIAEKSWIVEDTPQGQRLKNA
jgi:cysteinyl-tRNA synthetase